MGYRWRRCASGWWQRGYGGRRSARGRGFTRAGPDGRLWASWCRSTVPPHAWFEDRGQRCTLIVFIDDATSRLMALRFAEAETTEPPRTPTATCSMTQSPSTSSSPSIPPESSAAISPAVTAAASTRSKARAAATASVAPPSPSVKASTAPSPSCAKARPSTTECSLKASRPSPQTTKKASAVPSTRPAPSSVNALATNPPQTTPGTAGLASTQPLPPLPHSHPRLVPLYPTSPGSSGQ